MLSSKQKLFFWKEEKGAPYVEMHKSEPILNSSSAIQLIPAMWQGLLKRIDANEPVLENWTPIRFQFTSLSTV